MNKRRQRSPAHWKLAFLVLAVIFRGGLWAGAQNFQVRSWHVENGLPDGTITALAQTADGYLWVGTRKGLVRFDGVSFSRVDDSAGTALADPRITGLLVDRQDSLWIASESGSVTEFSKGEFRVRHAAASETNGSDAGLPIARGRLALDGEGAVWAMLEDGTVLRFRGSAAPSTPAKNQLPQGSPGWMVADGAGQIWLAKGRDVCVFRHDHWAPVPADSGGPAASWVNACAARKNQIWVAAMQGSWLSGSWLRRRTADQWDGSLLSPPPAPESSRSQISAILEDREGRLWLGMYWSGVYVQNQPGKWERVQMQGPLAQSVVTCLLEDQDGAIWAGAIGEGLHQIVPKLVSMVSLPPDANESIVNTAFAAKDGSVWIGTDGNGIFRWEPGRYTRYGQTEGLPHGHVCAILQDAQSNLWAGTWDGLARFGKNHFVPIVDPPELRQPVLALYSDRAGNLWVGGNGRLLEWQGETNWLALHSDRTSEPLDIRCITEDATGAVWVAAMGAGLLQVQGHELVPAGRRIGLKRMDVRSVLGDKEGGLWIGTFNDGLFRHGAGRLRHYTMADGLPDDSIISLVTDDLGNLWMSSNNGIFGCSRQRLATYLRGQSPRLLCWQLTPSNGLDSRGCSGSGQPVATRTADGRIWIADMRGVACLDPKTVTQGSSSPNALVEFVTGDDVTLHPAGAGVLHAPASTRRFEFHYTAPDLAAPQTLRFRYRLEPLDREWGDAGAFRMASYSQLPAGKYRFRVMVGGADGQWHEAAEPVSLIVVPQFWQTAWFRAACAGIVVAAIMVTVIMNERRKLRRRMERMEAQQALEGERRRIARDLHDDLGAGLVEVVLLGELSRQGSVPSDKLPQHVSSMTDKTRALVTAMDEIVWTINPRNDSVKSLAAYLSEYMQRFLAPAMIRCRISIPDDLPATPISAQFRHNILLAVKEVLHNVAKHSGAQEVWLRVECNNGELTLNVADDGKGFDPAACAGRRNGLLNIRGRLESLGGRTVFQSQPGRGTTVVFTIPLVRNSPVK